MIRPITPDDTDALIALASSVNLFSSDDLEELRQMLTDALSKDGDTHPFWITDDDDGLVGFMNLTISWTEPEA